jgi:hypothetical protein
VHSWQHTAPCGILKHGMTDMPLLDDYLTEDELVFRSHQRIPKSA